MISRRSFLSAAGLLLATAVVEEPVRRWWSLGSFKTPPFTGTIEVPQGIRLDPRNLTIAYDQNGISRVIDASDFIPTIWDAESGEAVRASLSFQSLFRTPLLVPFVN